MPTLREFHIADNHWMIVCVCSDDRLGGFWNQVTEQVSANNRDKKYAAIYQPTALLTLAV